MAGILGNLQSIPITAGYAEDDSVIKWLPDYERGNLTIDQRPRKLLARTNIWTKNV